MDKDPLCTGMDKDIPVSMILDKKRRWYSSALLLFVLEGMKSSPFSPKCPVVVLTSVNRLDTTHPDFWGDYERPHHFDDLRGV